MLLGLLPGDDSVFPPDALGAYRGATSAACSDSTGARSLALEASLMTGRHAASLAHLARARRVTPAGAQTMSKAAPRFVEGAFPTAVTRAQGCHVWTVDGTEMIDWGMACAAVALGYAHPVVNDAIRRQLARGTTASLPYALEAEVSEALLAVLPWTAGDGMVRWVSTGSEATEAAVRVARIVTGRDLVLSIGYHSWFATWMAQKPVRPGVPDVFGMVLWDLPYNDLATLDDVLSRGPTKQEPHGHRLAAIIIEPTLLDPPAPGYLEGLRERCDRLGALLIFDEIVTGFRWHLGGAAAYFGIRPDLACYGKALGNGVPVACLVGRREVMQEAGVLISGTMGGNGVGLAAAQAVLELYQRDPVIRMLWLTGEKFQAGFNERAKVSGVPVEIVGYPVHPVIRFTEHDETWRRLAMSVFLQETAARGVLFHPAGNNSSFAHTQEDIDRSLDACEAAFRVIQAAGDDLASVLKGKPMEPSLIRVADQGHGGAR